jgi:hypothetical protein
MGDADVLDILEEDIAVFSRRISAECDHSRKATTAGAVAEWVLLIPTPLSSPPPKGLIVTHRIVHPAWDPKGEAL